MKIDRQGLVEAAIAGSATGIFFGCVVVAARWTTDAGDILGFFGAAFGAAVTVVGALFVERVKIAREMQRKRERLEMAIAEVVIMSWNVVRHDGDGNELMAHLLCLRQALSIFINSRPYTEALSQEVSGCLEALSHWTPRVQADIDANTAGFWSGEVAPEIARARMRQVARVAADQWLLALTVGDEWSGKGIARITAAAPDLIHQ